MTTRAYTVTLRAANRAMERTPGVFLFALAFTARFLLRRLRRPALALRFACSPRRYVRRRVPHMSDIQCRRAANLSASETRTLMESMESPGALTVLAIVEHPSGCERDLQALLDIHNAMLDAGYTTLPGWWARPQCRMNCLNAIQKASVAQLRRGR